MQDDIYICALPRCALRESLSAYISSFASRTNFSTSNAPLAQARPLEMLMKGMGVRRLLSSSFF